MTRWWTLRRVLTSAPTIAILVVCAVPAVGIAAGKRDRAIDRAAMVANIGREIRTAAPDADGDALRQALDALGSVPREEFVAPRQRKDAYREQPLPIGHEQTISDAYIVAVMTAALGPVRHGNVLDVGTGSGYQAAVLSLIADRVSSIEIVAPLAASAAKRLRRLGYANVSVKAGDGYAGWPIHAPFDGIVVAAGAAEVPQPLLEQLRVGGRLVMPIGPGWASEQVLVVTKTGPTTSSRCSLGWSMFVPFTGVGVRRRSDAGLFQNIPACYSGPIARPDFVAARDAMGG